LKVLIIKLILYCFITNRKFLF